MSRLIACRAAVLAFLLPNFLSAQERGTPAVPDLRQILAEPKSEFAEVIRRYEADRGSLHRTYTVLTSPTRDQRLRRFYHAWLKAVQEFDPTRLSTLGKKDHQQLIEAIQKDLTQLNELASRHEKVLPYLPFASDIAEFEETRLRMRPVDAMKAAGIVHQIPKHLQATRDKLQKQPIQSRAKVLALADTVAHLRATLRNWFHYYNGYDPLFTWWLAEPYKDADSALGDFLSFLRETLAPKAPDEPATTEASSNPTPLQTTEADPAPDLSSILREPISEMQPVIRRFIQDRGLALGRRAQIPNAPPPPRSLERLRELESYFHDWLCALFALDFDALSLDAKIDFILLRNHLERELGRLRRQIAIHEAANRIINFDTPIHELVALEATKVTIDDVITRLKNIQQLVETALGVVKAGTPDYELAAEAARRCPMLKASLADWNDKWSRSLASPQLDRFRGAYKALQTQLDHLTNFLREKSGPARDGSGIEGRPIGREALLLELRHEFIPYTPEELIAIAEHEYAWCLGEMKKASRDMGFGDDWLAAVEKVKTLHVAPGQQPMLIRELSDEAVDYLRRHDLVTVPDLCNETWRSEMMPPPRQLFSPFFTGGEVISIAFPTNTMSHDAKIQSLRGNNIHFARATVHHELIPGHHLQGFMTARHKSYRGIFGTSFWTEGNALYWEFVLYQMGFPRTPEDRVGFLTWRMHRCARVVFSVSYHLGRMTPRECIEYLVKNVGFERENATAEVRRSFSGGYGPLYQLSYLIGGLQFWALRQEILAEKRRSEREFHDALLQQGRIPVPLIRAYLREEKLTKDSNMFWRFYGDPPTSPARSEAP